MMEMFQLLIVDDEKLVADGLAQYIQWQEAGFSIAGVAYGADEALEIIRARRVDVLLTDIIMGEKNGIELIEEALRLNDGMKSVIVSGHEEFEYAKSAIRLGVYDYLVKPVDFEELLELFRKLGARMRREKSQPGDVQQEVPEAELQQEQSEGLIINTVKEYISQHYAEPITLQTLADIVYVHPTYLSILFKKKAGCNFKDYLAATRIEHAVQLLDDLSLRISDVGEMVGYDGPKHFSKVFKEIMGTTPKDYRNRQQN